MQNKNQVFILSGLVAVALLAVGVTTYSLSSGQSGQVSARQAAKASETVVAVAPESTNPCSLTNPCVEVRPGEPIKIAPMFASTGAGALIGKDDARGLWLAHQARHQVAGREVEFVGKPAIPAIGTAPAIPAEFFELENGVRFPNWNDVKIGTSTAGYGKDIIDYEGGIVAVIGTTRSSGSLVAGPIFSAAKLMMMTPQALSPDLTRRRVAATAGADGLTGDYVARSIPSGALQTIDVAKYPGFCGGDPDEDGPQVAKTFATITDSGNSGYSEGISAYFAAECGDKPRGKGSVRIIPSNPIPITDYNTDSGTFRIADGGEKVTTEAALAKILSKNTPAGTAPDLIYLVYTDAATTGNIIRWMREYTVNGSQPFALENTKIVLPTPSLYGETATNPGVWRAAHSLHTTEADNFSAVGVYASASNFYYDVNWNNVKVQPNTKLEKFYRKYGDAFPGQFRSGRIPPGIGEFPPFMVDGYNIVLDAIEKVAFIDNQGTMYIPRIALKDAIINDTDAAGITGRLDCNNASGSIIGPNYVGDCNGGLATAMTRLVCFDGPDEGDATEPDNCGWIRQ